jgi:hypothetical protein
VLVQERKLAYASFPPWWDVVRDEVVLVQEGKLAAFRHSGMMLSEMNLCLCKRES